MFNSAFIIYSYFLIALEPNQKATIAAKIERVSSDHNACVIASISPPCVNTTYAATPSTKKKIAKNKYVLIGLTEDLKFVIHFEAP